MSQPAPRETPRIGLNGTTPVPGDESVFDVSAPEDLLPEDHGHHGCNGHADPGDELRRLRLDNAALRHRLDEVEYILLEGQSAEEEWAERQRDYEAILEEKTEVIRELHERIAVLREAPAPEAAPAPTLAEEPDASGLTAAERHELMALKAQIDEDRAQLDADEEGMMQQMRQMEMAMSRERAELARQRSEIQRLHAELRHEIDQAARDSSLRERLAPLQRRHQQEVTKATEAENGSGSEKRSSGLFRRMFGG